ncbi:hypothetical protein [Streptosporangium sp. NPDC004631]
MPWDPRSGITFGEYLRRKSLQTPPAGGWTYATRDQHAYGERPDGVSFRATTDQLGNVVTEHADGRQDVTINLKV